MKHWYLLLWESMVSSTSTPTASPKTLVPLTNANAMWPWFRTGSLATLALDKFGCLDEFFRSTTRSQDGLKCSWGRVVKLRCNLRIATRTRCGSLRHAARRNASVRGTPGSGRDSNHSRSRSPMLRWLGSSASSLGFSGTGTGITASPSTSTTSPESDAPKSSSASRPVLAT